MNSIEMSNEIIKAFGKISKIVHELEDKLDIEP